MKGKCIHCNKEKEEDYAERWSIYQELLGDLGYAIRMKGHPDFFIIGKKSYYFCEFKSKGDTLSIDQIKFFNEYRHFPCVIAIASKDDLQEEIPRDSLKENENLNSEKKHWEELF
jgi:hypothetical protein